MRAGDDIYFAVVIEIADVRAFAPELVGELDLFERVQDVIFGGGDERGGQGESGGDGNCVHALCLDTSRQCGQVGLRRRPVRKLSS